MKRGLFLKHLKQHHCVLAREGTKHSIYKNLESNKAATVPRHSNLNEITCKIICKQPGIPYFK